jgi:hypothetical protein
MTDALERQLGAIARELGGDAADVKLERPRNPDHGDVASNLALVLAGRLGRPPRAIAADVLARLDVRTFRHQGSSRFAWPIRSAGISTSQTISAKNTEAKSHRPSRGIVAEKRLASGQSGAGAARSAIPIMGAPPRPLAANTPGLSDAGRHEASSTG